jgi:hypothetical protein
MQWALMPSRWSTAVSHLPYDFSTEGDKVSLTWTPRPEKFVATIYVWLLVRNSSGYFAQDFYDDARIWAYTFEPPY